MPVEDIDHGWKRIVETLAKNDDGAVCRVGFLQEKDNIREGAGASTPTNAELAAIHEFGTPDGHIPERSFIRSTFDGNRGKYEALVEKLAGEVVDGKMKIERLLGLVGAKMASDIRRTVKTGAGVPPPNAPSTVKRKGSSRPLIDTSQMLNALTWLVTKGDGDAS